MSASAQDWARAELDKSTRHQEWVTIRSGNKTLQAFIVYPEVSKKAPVIVMIHEIFGLTDWVRSMADELAAQGYIVIAPDLLSGTGPNGGGSSAYPDQDARVKAVSALKAESVMADLNATADYAKKLPAANGKLAVIGFCWGGGKSFQFATVRHDLSAAFVFYGPPPEDLTAITAPVYGFYAGNDARITSTVPATQKAMQDAGKTYDPVVYEGAGHGFMRMGVDPGNTNMANVKARKEAMERLETLLKGM
ncbi:MAG TPA: dienelactone hydrolase family protein [Terracidiphilus sp.]|nr:dienelactone hydrolase family protein [Terracidiphilus sp.]